MIAVLAIHLNGEYVSFYAQEAVNSGWDSDDLDEAFADVEQRLAALSARRDIIAARIRAIMRDADGIEISAITETVSLADLLRPELSKQFKSARAEKEQ